MLRRAKFEQKDIKDMEMRKRGGRRGGRKRRQTGGVVRVSRETESIWYIYIHVHQEIYHKVLAQTVMEAEKFHGVPSTS